MSVLEVDDVSTSIEGISILRDVDLTVEEGSRTAIVGPNGAGKTTTFRTVMGLNDPTEGQIRFDGTDLVGMPVHERKRLGIGFAPEDRGLIHQLTTRENIEMFLWGQDDVPGETETDDRIDAMLEFFPDMADFMDRPAGQLSGGQQQMVAIARALVADPDLLLLDEPFEGLAPAIRSSLKSNLIENIGDDVAVFISESEINHIADVADRIHVIDRGDILATDLTYEELQADDDLMGIIAGG